ncbi:MAG: ligase-associated DNA damage response DEXH box helicase [Saprospirales bacterium]|nr:MAG: ligase-associated DNA damage response DEXH box helicase [Saprospirales bacterium]
MENDWKRKGIEWFIKKGWKPFSFQLQCWDLVKDGGSGLLNAPTGSGKTYALLIPLALMASEIDSTHKGVKVIWISPVRALASQILLATNQLIEGLDLNITAGLRTGDSSASERKKQVEKPPDILITTPESLHLWMSSAKTQNHLKNVQAIVADEWHELMGSKRGVQFELAAALLRFWNPQMICWGISATLANTQQSLEILMGDPEQLKRAQIVKADIKKEIQIKTILPDDILELPWAGHIGLKMLEKVGKQLHKAGSSLIFTNTRSQCEIWYQRLLEALPELAGLMAMHHSAIDEKTRHWVEDSLHNGKLKVVVCTSSLDLGVDFRPVEQVIQIGGPKGVSRFMQRAGRSGHQPGMPAKIFFVPTHAMELLEASAVKAAVQQGLSDEKIPYLRSFDVLVQFLMTLACGNGFDPDELFGLIKNTFSYRSLSREEWEKVIQLLLYGGSALESYDEYRKVDRDVQGKIRVLNKQLALRHRMSIGTITGDQSLSIHYANGRRLGTVEEWFFTHLTPGDVFWFSGKALEFESIRGNKVIVSKSTAKTAKIPAWMGGRMPLSSELGNQMRLQLNSFTSGEFDDEIKALLPLLEIQKERSAIPLENQLLIEQFESREGFHLFLYPFEGRFVHEGIAALLSSRIAAKIPISFSLAMNDYGLELLAPEKWSVEEILKPDLFDSQRLMEAISTGIKETELAKRKFRDIAMIAGLLFRGFPGREKKARHLISSSSLIFDVMDKYDPENLLYLQAYEEVKTFQMEESRMRNTLNRIISQEWVIVEKKKPSPFCLPLMADRLRERISSEKVEDRVKRMLQ